MYCRRWVMLIGMLLVFNEKIMLICIVNFITIQITMMYCTVYSIDRFKNKHVMTIYLVFCSFCC